MFINHITTMTWLLKLTKLYYEYTVGVQLLYGTCNTIPMLISVRGREGVKGQANIKRLILKRFVCKDVG